MFRFVVQLACMQDAAPLKQACYSLQDQADTSGKHH
jgi:hypothetical protein